MKKIITLITMFVLSVGFLMAQGGFTYQAVVVDAQGNLVANQEVTATVTIKDANLANNPFTQVIEDITTSLNGLAVFSIGEGLEGEALAKFNSIDWKTAQIKVDYEVTGTAMPNEDFEQVAAVPYALQSRVELSNDMVANYVQNATMNDYKAILEAAQGNGSLYGDVLNAIIDSITNHYDLAKEILMAYIAAANKHDVDTIFEAVTGNSHVMNALANVAVDIWANEQGKEMIYDVLKAYAPQLTGDDVADILKAVTPEVRDTILSRAVKFYLDLGIDYTDEAIHAALEQITKYYIEHISIPQVEGLIYAIEQSDLLEPLQDQFNAWIDYYVDSVVADYINQRYFKTNADCSTPNLCDVKAALEGTCVSFASSTFNFANPTSAGDYVGTISYSGTLQCHLEVVSIDGHAEYESFHNDSPSGWNYAFTNGVLTVVIPKSNLPESIGFPTDEFSVTIKVNVDSDCSCEPITLTGGYTFE